MPDLESQIFSMALIFFLLIGSAKLTIEQLITLVILFKKLKATIESEYSLKTGKLESPTRDKLDGASNETKVPETGIHIASRQGLEVDHQSL
jgi:hypothetical protein